ncbi:MAG: Ohr family peroxiredoxin [Gloeobacteraceae cyanobacterium ES-bin-144]|nr:Ohr family peroxiredoxin [Verrucomicrobiales bacterium]
MPVYPGAFTDPETVPGQFVIDVLGSSPSLPFHFDLNLVISGGISVGSNPPNEVGFYPIGAPWLTVYISLMIKTLFTAEAVSEGGRSGTLHNPDGLLDLTLGNPLEKGIELRGPNPELLFAGAYAACYNGAMVNAAKTLGIQVGDTTVRALVSLIEDDQGGYHLAVELYGAIPGTHPSEVLRIMNAAHQTCPYSRALRGDTTVKLVVA